jgi:F-type H+-transporting ATPase subunit delta
MIATRYAKSLLDLAVEQNLLDNILEDMEVFKQALNNREFYLLLKSPLVKQDKKVSIFNSIFSGKVNKMTIAFLNILARKGRENILPEITTEFFNQYKDLKNISTVKVTSSSPMTESQIASLKNKLQKSDIVRENIDLITEVDKSLIGGMVVEIGDKMYNATVAHNLRSLKKEFNG